MYCKNFSVFHGTKLRVSSYEPYWRDIQTILTKRCKAQDFGGWNDRRPIFCGRTDRKTRRRCIIIKRRSHAVIPSAIAVKPSVSLKEICLEFGHVAKHFSPLLKRRVITLESFASCKIRTRPYLRGIKTYSPFVSSSIEPRAKFHPRRLVPSLSTTRTRQQIATDCRGSCNVTVILQLFQPGDAYFINYQSELSSTNYRFAVRRLTTNEGCNGDVTLYETSCYTGRNACS